MKRMLLGLFVLAIIPSVAEAGHRGRSSWGFGFGYSSGGYYGRGSYVDFSYGRGGYYGGGHYHGHGGGYYHRPTYRHHYGFGYAPAYYAPRVYYPAPVIVERAPVYIQRAPRVYVVDRNYDDCHPRAYYTEARYYYDR
jgi:hypothetical protein